MSWGYRWAYRLGLTPWEAAGKNSGFDTHLKTILDREQAARHGPVKALDIGCGTGHHSFEMAARGWRVTGVDAVATAIDKAQAKARAANSDAVFIRGDVTGCFHGLPDRARAAYAQQVTAVTDLDASLLMFVFPPAHRGPLPRGASRSDIERTFNGWHLAWNEPADTEGLPTPIRRLNPRWFGLTRTGTDSPQPKDSPNER